MKGFTLIELLAVLIILAIILLIAYPLISNIIEGAKRGGFESSMKLIIDQAKKEYVKRNLDGDNRGVEYKFEDHVQTTTPADIPNLNFNGTGPKDGVIVVTNTGEVSANLTDGNYYIETDGDGNLTDSVVYVPATHDPLLGGSVAVVTFTDSFGGTNYENYNSVIRTSDGGYVAVGAASSDNGELTGYHTGPTSQQDGIIVKYDVTGTLLWKKNYGTSSGEKFYGVAEMSDGSLVAVGNYSASSTYGLVVKFDSSGNFVYQKYFGGTNSTYFYSIVADDLGAYTVGGQSLATDGDLAGYHYGASSNDMIFVKYDSSGNILNRKNFGGTSDDISYSLIKVGSNYVFSGSSRSTTDNLLNKNNGGWDGIIGSFDNSMTLLFIENFGGSSNDYFEDIKKTVDNGYVAVGYSWSNDIDLDGMSNGNGDAIIVKFNGTGDTVLWKNNFGGSSDDYFYGVDVTPTNEIVVVGDSDSTDVDLASKNKGSSDGIIVKYNSAGNTVLLNENFGGTDWETFNKVKFTPDGGLIAVGSSYSNDLDLLGLSNGAQDCLIAKLSPLLMP